MQKLTVWTLQVILGLCVAQRIVSKLSKKKKKKKNHSYPPFRASLLSLNSVPKQFEEHCILAGCFQRNFLSCAFLNRAICTLLSSAIAGLRVPLFQPSLWFLQDQTQSSTPSFLFPLQIRKKRGGGGGLQEWWLGSQSSVKHHETKTWLKYRILTTRNSHKLESKKHRLGPSRSQKNRTFYMLLKKENNIKAWTGFVCFVFVWFFFFFLLNQLHYWLTANSQQLIVCFAWKFQYFMIILLREKKISVP